MPIKERTENHCVARAACACAGMLLLGLTGCGSFSRDQRIETSSRDDAFVEYAGNSSELVFSGLGIQGAPDFRPSESTLLAGRNDPRLAPRGQPNSTTRLAYPERGPRSLDQLRVIYLQPRPDRVQYFRDDDRRRW